MIANINLVLDLMLRGAIAVLAIMVAAFVIGSIFVAIKEAIVEGGKHNGKPR